MSISTINFCIFLIMGWIRCCDTVHDMFIIIIIVVMLKKVAFYLLGVAYHVKKVSTIFDENLSQNINLKKECSSS